mgnify:CR=1 FL=1
MRQQHPINKGAKAVWTQIDVTLGSGNSILGFFIVRLHGELRTHSQARMFLGSFVNLPCSVLTISFFPPAAAFSFLFFFDIHTLFQKIYIFF